MANAPAQFAVMPPPRLVDLTSDFFTQPAKREGQSLIRNAATAAPAREKRMIINNPRQNAVMVDLGKCRIRQLKNY